MDEHFFMWMNISSDGFGVALASLWLPYLIEIVPKSRQRHKFFGIFGYLDASLGRSGLALHNIELGLHYITLYCIVLYYIILYYVILYYII